MRSRSLSDLPGVTEFNPKADVVELVDTLS